MREIDWVFLFMLMVTYVLLMLILWSIRSENSEKDHEKPDIFDENDAEPPQTEPKNDEKESLVAPENLFLGRDGLYSMEAYELNTRKKNSGKDKYEAMLEELARKE